MARYELRVIHDSYQQHGHQIQPLGAPIYTTEDPCEMDRRASAEGSAHYYGVAIVDTVDGTVNWGDEITALRGEITVGQQRCRLELRSDHV